MAPGLHGSRRLWILGGTCFEMNRFRVPSLLRTVLKWDPAGSVTSPSVPPSAAPGGAAARRDAGRVAWVDYAKGWSIVLVVVMHSALGVGFAVGENSCLHAVVAFAKPFRMPDFFLVAGLFAGRSMAARGGPSPMARSFTLSISTRCGC